MGQSDPVLEDEVKYRYYTIIQLYRRATLQDNAQRVSPVSFELEAALKLARYLCRRELAKEVSDLLMGAADGAKALIDASDRLILYIEIARLFGTLGYKRKAAFFFKTSCAIVPSAGQCICCYECYAGSNDDYKFIPCSKPEN
uniref:Uncharacterized protein n=1 Tax=Arundo donax TaxID=35708 RepID=A0A0A9FXT9_ARUDO